VHGAAVAATMALQRCGTADDARCGAASVAATLLLLNFLFFIFNLMTLGKFKIL